MYYAVAIVQLPKKKTRVADRMKRRRDAAALKNKNRRILAAYRATDF